MEKRCTKCGKKCDEKAKKCDKCGGRLEIVYSEKELEEIKKMNDDITVINTMFF